MEKFFELIRVMWMGICVLFGYLFGDFDGLLGGLITFVIIDYITGITAAIINKELSSKIGFSGILRKIVIFAIVAVAKILSYNILGVGLLIRDAVIGFYLFNEGISILENVKHMGVKVPDDIMSALSSVKDKFKFKTDNDKKEDTDEDNK